MEENKIEEKEVEVVETKQEEKTSAVENKSNGLSIASLVLGLVGLIIAALPCGIMAIIFGLMGKKRGGNGMATAGFILGIADIALWVVFFVIGLITAASMFMSL